MVKVGQRKFLLRCGYTDEQLDKMPVSTARGIISNIESQRARERAAAEEQDTIDSSVVFFKDVVLLSRAEYERLINK